MSTFIFDTLSQAESLQKYGFEEKQAKGIVEIIAITTNNLATKQDLDKLKFEIQSEMKHENLKIRMDMQQEYTNIRDELRTAVSLLDKKILRMSISLALVNITTLGGYTTLLQWLKL